MPVKINIVNLGRAEREFRGIIGEYEKRLKHMAHVKFSRKIPENAILLDEKGKEMNSEEFYRLILKNSREGREITFVIGPPEGFSEDLKKKHKKITVSKFTLRHEIAYLVLLEQIYRSLLRIRGTDYEK